MRRNQRTKRGAEKTPGKEEQKESKRNKRKRMKGPKVSSLIFRKAKMNDQMRQIPFTPMTREKKREEQFTNPIWSRSS